MDKVVIRRKQDVTPVTCPCGLAFRVIGAMDSSKLSVHFVEISSSSRPHFHRSHTEVYIVIRGSGEIELDGRTYAVGEGTVVCIPPGTVHRAVGDMEIVNVVIPPFDPADEYEVQAV